MTQFGNYLLLSQGQAGNFKWYYDTDTEAIESAKRQLANGQECALYVKHSNLKFQEITVEKTEMQLKAEEAEATVGGIGIEPAQP